MLKWFRKYNKYILSIGVSILMIAFLVPQSLQMLGDSSSNYTLGTIGELEIKIDDQRRAASDLQLLSRIFSRVHPQLPNFACNVDAINWLLMTHEARSMQLSAGNRDAAALLTQLGYTDLASINQITSSSKLPVEEVYRVMADWIMVESYKELITGRAHVPVEKRINEYVNILRELSKGYPLQYLIPPLIQASQGLPRMSAPVLMRAAADQAGQATIEAVSVGIDQYISDVQSPYKTKLDELFDKYKDDLVGESKPYGFGYRFPDRVKIEFIAFPFDRLVDFVQVDESELLRYYDDNHSEFTVTPPPPDTPDTPASDGESESEAAATPPAPFLKRYAQVRQQIVNKLHRQAAEKLSRQLAGRAQKLLRLNMRSLASKEGYRVLPEQWKPVPLNDVAAKLQEQFKVLADVTVLDQTWLNEQSLALIPGLGTSRLADNNRTSFVDYALGVREGNREDYTGPRLQTGVPSMTVSNFDGSLYIFRVIEAAPSRTPDSLDQVRDKVTDDALRLAAYNRLRDQQATWQKRLTDAASMEDLAKQLKTTVIQPQPFSRRTPGYLGGQPQVPTLDAIGQSEDVVDQTFDLANRLAAKSDGKIQDLPAAERSMTIANDTNLTLCLVRLTDYKPLKQSDYDRYAASTQAAQVTQQSLVKLDEPLDPFGYDALARRTGYKTDQE